MSEQERPEPGRPQEGLPEPGRPERGLPEPGLPEESPREPGLPEEGLPERGLPGEGLPERGLPEPGLPEEGLPGEGERGEPTPGSNAERRQLEADFLLAIRRAGSIMQLLGQVSADRIGINATDLNCLNIVALTGHTTAGELARRTGLTTASITGVLDRLEEGGFVRRERDPHDRRRVIVNLSGGPGLHQVGETFAPVVKAWRAAAATYSDDELRLLLDFQQRLEEIVRGQLARLRGEGAGPDG